MQNERLGDPQGVNPRSFFSSRPVMKKRTGLL